MTGGTPGRARLVLHVLGLILVLATSAPGLWSAIHELPQAHNTGQVLTGLGDALYGVCGLVIVGLALWSRNIPRALVAAWAVVITATAAAAPVTWGRADARAAALAGISAAVVATVIFWLVRRGNLHR